MLKLAHQAFKNHLTDILTFLLFDSSYGWPGIKCLTHFSPWQFTSLYFPSHCRGQEAVFIRARDAEIVSCLCSCQFQLVREQLSPIGQTQIGDTLSPSDWSPLQIPGLWLVEGPSALWSRSEPLAWIHNNLETDNMQPAGHLGWDNLGGSG